METWNFSVIVTFGKCDSGESNIDWEVSDDMYKYLTVASELGYDFDDYSEEETIEAIKSIEKDDGDLNWEEMGFTFEEFKKIDIDSLDFDDLDDVYDAAYEQEEQLYADLYGSDEEFDFSISIR